MIRRTEPESKDTSASGPCIGAKDDYHVRMSKTVFNKLVRDRIPEIVRNNGETANFRVLSERLAFLSALLAKILEESEEVRVAVESEDPAEIAKEIADVREVLDAIAAEFAIPPEEIERVQSERREKR